MTEPAPGSAEASSASAAPSSSADLTERVVESRPVHRGRYLEVRVDTVERADGSQTTRDIVRHPGAAAIVAIDADDRLLMVRQFRLPAGGVLLEIPAGTLDVGPDGAAEDPDAASRRELEEETGYRAERWEKLAAFWTAPGFATELMHLYLATDLRPVDAGGLGPEEDERLEVVRLTLDEALRAVQRGEIADAKSIVGLLWLARRRAMQGAGATQAVTAAATP